GQGLSFMVPAENNSGHNPQIPVHPFVPVINYPTNISPSDLAPILVSATLSSYISGY
ncbi:unnamed protein product, partial [Rotaria magnacalcarata]